MLWSVPLSDGGCAGPSVAGGKVFVIDHQGTNDVVRAIDFKTGKDVWTYRYKDTEAPNYGYSQSTPLIFAGKVYVNGRLGLVACLDAKTGKKVWDNDILTTFNGKKPGFHFAISPVVDGNKLIVCPGGPDASVAALDIKTGGTIWKGGGSDIPGYATPVMTAAGAKKLFVVLTGVSLIGVDAADGKLLWSVPWKTTFLINVSTPIVMGNTVFINSDYDQGCALVQFSATEAKILWQNKGHGFAGEHSAALQRLSLLHGRRRQPGMHGRQDRQSRLEAGGV